MTDTTQCDDCGARNAADARWCSQCYRSLADEHAPVASSVVARPVTTGPARPPALPPPAAAPTSPPPSSPPPSSPRLAPAPAGHGLLPLPGEESSTPTPPPPARLAAGDGRFRRAEDGLEWSCAVCERWNPLERTTCTVCEAPFLAPTEEAGPVRSVDPVLLVGATLVLPGAGHALLGLAGQAFFRVLLALVWGAGGMSLLLDALSVGQPVLPAVPLLLGWLVLAGASVNDVLVAAGGPGRVLLHGRVVLWLVLGVIAATVAAAFVGALAAVGG